MSTLLALALAHGGFALLAFSMDRHHRQLVGRPADALRRRWLPVAGTIALTLSFAACIGATDWDSGSTLWVGLIALAAGIVLLQLTYRPRSLMPAAAVASPAMLFLLLLSEVSP